jgi:FKBP-type peptidyl-prolyl cis-trans isomerase 2
MNTATFGKTVKVHYRVKLDDGTIVDDTRDHEPFIFTLGMMQVIPGFELAVMGMSPGTSKTVEVDVEKAYGPRFRELVTEVDRSDLPADFKFEVGQHLEMPREDGQYDIVTVLNITEKTVTLDKNHPLAGKNLTLDIELLEII